jgi:hypothetical protein
MSSRPGVTLLCRNVSYSVIMKYVAIPGGGTARYAVDMCRPAVGEVQVLLRILCMFSVFRGVASSVMWKMKTLCK